MNYEIIPVTPFQQNCTLIWCDTTRHAALLDPGGEPEKLMAAVAKADVKVGQILLTHGHLDHVGAAVTMAKKLQVEIYGPHRADDFLLENLPRQSQLFGLHASDPFTPHRWLTEGDEIKVGNMHFCVLHCPGHTPGHIVFINQAARHALVGDVIFKGSIGRTDFPRSSQQHLLASIHNKLLTLGDDMTFIPGHGLRSTFGHERQYNTFIR